MTTFTQDGPTFGGSAHIVPGSTEWKQHMDKLIAESDKTPSLATLFATRARFDPEHYAPWGGAWSRRQKEKWMKRHADRVEDVEKVKKSLDIAAAAAAAAAVAAAAGAAAGAPVKEKKRKPKFSPAKYDATTTEEEKDDDIPEKDDDIPPPPPAPLEGLRSPTDPFTLTELEDMHKKIVQKCAPIIDGFSALNIFEVSYVEHKLKEIKNDFRKDYERNHQYVKFFKRVNKQGKTEGNADVKGGAKGGSKGRKKK
jgi:hypothetical protein